MERPWREITIDQPDGPMTVLVNADLADDEVDEIARELKAWFERKHEEEHGGRN